MHNRMNMQPDPMKDYVLLTDDCAYVGRWLPGNTYEGWYLTGIVLYADDEDKIEELTPRILSQKELKVIEYVPVEDYELAMSSEEARGIKVHRYIPKALLDEAFYGRQEISDFRCTPDILCYL